MQFDSGYSGVPITRAGCIKRAGWIFHFSLSFFERHFWVFLGFGSGPLPLEGKWVSLDTLHLKIKKLSTNSPRDLIGGLGTNDMN